jgi:catechol 2,3-dioxygenase-like lactoylglutathione lyase family enzyme
LPVIHHSAICVGDLDESLRFWRDGLGFEVTMDRRFEGDWPTLLHAPSRSLRSVFLGDPAHPASGTVELVDLGEVASRPVGGGPVSTGFLLLSVVGDVAGTLARLSDLGLGGTPLRTEVAGIAMAVVTDPDGVLVELIDEGASANLDRLARSGAG